MVHLFPSHLPDNRPLEKELATDDFEVFVPKDEEVQVVKNKSNDKTSSVPVTDANEETETEVEILEDYDPKRIYLHLCFHHGFIEGLQHRQ